MAIERTQGSVLAGRFRLDRLLGQGGMGVVWAATNTATGRRVAIKMLRDEGAADPHTRRRFLREGRAASAVSHPNVVEILDVLELEDQTPAMVMEMLDGESLGQRLRREKTIPLPELARILVPAIGAIGTAHAHGIVHRDLKPDNIFLAQGHEGAMVVKVLDFGITKMTAEPEGGQSNALTGTGAMLGTPYYMAPEQLFSDETLDYRCDIWALGIILYECLAGVRPTKGDTFADIVKVIATQSITPFAKAAPGQPAEIADLVTRMLSFDKEKRPQSLREVCDVLQHHTDVLASSFGAPVLRPVRQGLDDSGENRGLKKSDVQFLVDGPASEHDKNASTVTIDTPVRPKLDSKLETLVNEPTNGDTQGGVGVSVRAPVVAPRKKVGGRTAALLTAVGMAIGVAGVYVAVTLKTSPSKTTTATQAPEPAAEPPAAPIVTTAAPAPSPAPSPTTKAEEPAPAKTVTAPVKTVAAKPTTKPAASAATTPAAPSEAKTGAPGGLVEKPPF